VKVPGTSRKKRFVNPVSNDLDTTSIDTVFVRDQLPLFFGEDHDRVRATQDMSQYHRLIGVKEKTRCSRGADINMQVGDVRHFAQSMSQSYRLWEESLGNMEMDHRVGTQAKQPWN
jgi:hypothetical protein